MPYKGMVFSILHTLTHDVRLLFFSIAILAYAVMGSPTPDAPSFLELVIAILLALAVGAVAPFGFVSNVFQVKAARWAVAAVVFFVYGLSIPLIMALCQGANLAAVMRDMVGFIFLCLPLFLWPFLKDNPVRQKYFIFLLLAVGLLFSWRVLFPHFFGQENTTELLYLANSPLVLFTALLLFSLACHKIFERVSVKNFTLAVLYFGLAVSVLLAMFVDIQRASFVALVLSGVLLFILGVVKAPLRVIVPLIIVAVSVFIFQAEILGVAEDVALKTARVGVNMRYQEILAVWEAVSASPMTLLWGQGWGASFASPAVGGLHVTYTHSLLSYVFFKMGLVGLCLCLFYLFFIFEKLVRLSLRYPVKGNAIMWPFLIPIFLYASHKSFDFGLLICAILVMGMQASFLSQKGRV